MTAILVIAAIIALVWAALLFRHTGLLGGCVALLCIGSCFGHPFFRVDIGPIPVTVDRLLWALLFMGYLVHRRWGATEPKPIDKQDLVLGAFILVLGISTFTHDWLGQGARSLAILLFYFLVPLTMYAVARDARLSPRAVLGVFAALAGFGIYLAVTAVFEQQQIWSLVFPRYVVSLEHHEFLGRARGPFLNPVGNGLFLCAGLFGLLMFWQRVSRPGKVVLAAVISLFLAGLYCTLTRSVWLGAVAGIMLIVVMNVPRRWGLALATAVTLLGVSGAAVKWNDLMAFKRDRDVSVSDMSRSANLRPILAYVAWQVFLDHPLTGCGPGHYRQAAMRYFSDRSTRLVLERGRGFVQHNTFLALLAETGLVGAGLFMALILFWCRSAWCVWACTELPLAFRQQGVFMLALLAAYLAMAMFHDMSIIPMVNMLVFFLAGVLRGVFERVACAQREPIGHCQSPACHGPLPGGAPC